MTDDPHADVTVEDALAEMESLGGDTYINPEIARGIVAGFSEALEAALDDDHDGMQDGALWLNRYVANITHLAKDVRGVPNVPQYEPLVDMEELSTTIAEDLDVDVGERKSVGYARSSREKHSGTVENLREGCSESTGAEA